MYRIGATTFNQRTTSTIKHIYFLIAYEMIIKRVSTLKKYRNKLSHISKNLRMSDKNVLPFGKNLYREETISFPKTDLRLYSMCNQIAELLNSLLTRYLVKGFLQE